MSISVDVLRVMDGDALDGVDRMRCEVLMVRLWGMDSPEMDQECGAESSDRLGEMLSLPGGGFLLEVLAFDRHGRAVGLLHPEADGCFNSVNLRMVAAGYAHCSGWKQGRCARQRMDFCSAESRARYVCFGGQIIRRGPGSIVIPGDGVWSRDRHSSVHIVFQREVKYGSPGPL